MVRGGLGLRLPSVDVSFTSTVPAPRQNEDGSFPLWKGIAAGMLAGATGQFIASPTDLVKVQMQMEGKRKLAGEKLRYNVRRRLTVCIHPHHN